MKNLHRTITLVVIALGGPACGDDFDPYSRVEGLRVLGVQSEPPAPAPGQTAVFKALVYTPKPDADIRYEWSWCPLAGVAREGFPCLLTAADIAKLAGPAAAATLPPFDLGTSPTAMFSHTVDPALLDMLCKQTPNCQGGFPVQLRVKISSGTETIDTVRTVRLRLEGETPANQNPAIDGLIRLASKETKDDGVPVTDEPTVTLPRRIEARIRALVKREHVEKYKAIDPKGNLTEQTERLTLAWFVETGDLANETTGFIEGAKGLVFEDSLINKWKPGKVKDYERTTSRVLVVIRDNRGGIGWTTGAVNLETKP